MPLVVAAVVVQQLRRDGLFRAEQEPEENAVVDEARRSLVRSLTEGEDAVHRAAPALVLADARIEEEARLTSAREAVNGAEIACSAPIFAANGSVIGAIEKRAEPAELLRPPLPAAPGREPKPRWNWSRRGIVHPESAERERDRTAVTRGRRAVAIDDSVGLAVVFEEEIPVGGGEVLGGRRMASRMDQR